GALRLAEEGSNRQELLPVASDGIPQGPGRDRDRISSCRPLGRDSTPHLPQQRAKIREQPVGCMTRRGQKLAALTMLLQSVRKGATDPKTAERCGGVPGGDPRSGPGDSDRRATAASAAAGRDGLVSTLRSLLSGLPRKWN